MNLFKIFLVLTLTFTASIASSSPSYYVALGGVAQQCGKQEQPPIIITNEDIIKQTAKNLGITRELVITTLQSPNQKMMTSAYASKLKNNFLNGYITCSSILAQFYAK